MSTDLNDFKDLLRDLFQFDHADLDFGIYRILNQKRDKIEDFIQEDLVEEISSELERLEAVEVHDVEDRFQDAREKVVNTFSEEALDRNDRLVEYQETPLGQEYIEVWEEWKQAQEHSASKEQVRRQIYDHLYRFFRRYYDDGDFVTKRRFSAGESKYAIPYDGEEVKLHWANRDQYYVKTSERFTDYRFNADDYHVHFKLVSADTPTDNTKGDTRYFIPFKGETVTIDEEDSTITIRFEYRPITDEEEEHYLEIYNDLPGKTYKTLNQERLCDALESILMGEIENPDVQSELAREDAQTEKSLLLTHLNRYTARNTSDYFIHKDLGGFLKGQLDYFIKSEVLHLEDILGDTSEGALKQAQVQADVVKTVGEKIIDFLAQIEDFQKRLFEKKKFVVKTDYCVTVDQVPEELYPQILDNDAQLEEWRELYAVEEWEQSLEWNGEFDETFLKTHPHAMIDTSHFGQAFKDLLLDSFEDLEDTTDGLLIHGENFQALNLLKEKFSEKIQCAYIDPPFNTGNDEFLYKDTYRHSSWLSMMEDRVPLERGLLKEGAVALKSIGEDELPRLRQLLEGIYGESEHLATFVWVTGGNIDNQSKFKQKHEYVTSFSNDKDSVPYPDVFDPNTPEDSKLFNESIENTIVKNSPKNPISEIKIPEGFPCEMEDGNIDPDDAEWPKFDDRIEIEGGRVCEPVVLRSGWSSKELIEEFIENDLQPVEDSRGRETTFYLKNTGAPYIRKKRSGQKGHVVSVLRNLGSTQSMSSTLQAMNLDFQYPKPTRLLSYLVEASSGDGDIILDYFAGSGSTAHGVMNLNRRTDEDRNYVLVEMGMHFDEVLLPRLKKVAFSDNWVDGSPKDRDGLSHFFKYHRLESYEDTLNNLQVEEPEGPQKELLYEEMDDYVLQYILEHETNGSPSLLAEDAFTHPFDYTLQIKQDGKSPESTTVDLVETFHYLIGMTVQEYTTAEHQGRRYVSTRGTVETSTGIDEVRCIWRDTEEPDALNLEEEATWAEENLVSETPADRIYVNSTTQIPGAKPVEIPFRDRMG